MSPVGETRDVGWQIGVSRTVDHPIEDVWALLASEAGLDLWLGKGARPSRNAAPAGSHATVPLARCAATASWTASA